MSEPPKKLSANYPMIEFVELEKRIGLRPHFFRELIDQEDWPFVIQLHALIEAACTHLLVYHFREPGLAKVVSRLELSGKTTGKVAFLKECELISDRSRAFIAALSELRNQLVHDVRNAQYSLTDMVATLTPEKVKSSAIAFSPYETFVRLCWKIPGRIADWSRTPHLKTQASIDGVLRRFEQTPRFHIWIGAANVLTDIEEQFANSNYRHWERQLEIEANGES